MLTDHVIQSNWWALTHSKLQYTPNLNETRLTPICAPPTKKRANAKDSPSASTVHRANDVGQKISATCFSGQKKYEMEIKKLFGLHTAKNSCMQPSIESCIHAFFRVRDADFRLWCVCTDTECNFFQFQSHHGHFYLHLADAFFALTFRFALCLRCLFIGIHPFTVQICVDWPWISGFCAFFRMCVLFHR